ncbi:MAG: hypothetical protein [Microviridae sp.]|nr:MAG: hypothetical protein [Microviridae sp.]
MSNSPSDFHVTVTNQRSTHATPTGQQAQVGGSVPPQCLPHQVRQRPSRPRTRRDSAVSSDALLPPGEGLLARLWRDFFCRARGRPGGHQSPLRTVRRLPGGPGPRLDPPYWSRVKVAPAQLVHHSDVRRGPHSDPSQPELF